MRGKTLSGLTLVVVSLVLCLLSSPVISGEHPWDRDNGSGSNNGTEPVDTTVVRQNLPGSSSAGSSVEGTSTPPRVTWQWNLMMRVTTWFLHYSYDTPVQPEMKRVRVRTGRN